VHGAKVSQEQGTRGKHKGDSGSARRDSPACAFTRCSALEHGGKRLWVRAPCKNNPEPGLSGAV
jgi:hypothetical protein